MTDEEQIALKTRLEKAQVIVNRMSWLNASIESLRECFDDKDEDSFLLLPLPSDNNRQCNLLRMEDSETNKIAGSLNPEDWSIISKEIQEKILEAYQTRLAALAAEYSKI